MYLRNHMFYLCKYKDLQKRCPSVMDNEVNTFPPNPVFRMFNTSQNNNYDDKKKTNTQLVYSNVNGKSRSKPPHG